MPPTIVFGIDVYIMLILKLQRITYIHFFGLSIQVLQIIARRNSGLNVDATGKVTFADLCQTCVHTIRTYVGL